jgi:hypothetical protein
MSCQVAGKRRGIGCDQRRIGQLGQCQSLYHQPHNKRVAENRRDTQTSWEDRSALPERILSPSRLIQTIMCDVAGPERPRRAMLGQSLVLFLCGAIGAILWASNGPHSLPCRYARSLFVRQSQPSLKEECTPEGRHEDRSRSSKERFAKGYRASFRLEVIEIP